MRCDVGFAPPPPHRLDKDARIATRRERFNGLQNGGLSTVVWACQQVEPRQIAKLVSLEAAVVFRCERAVHFSIALARRESHRPGNRSSVTKVSWQPIDRQLESGSPPTPALTT